MNAGENNGITKFTELTEFFMRNKQIHFYNDFRLSLRIGNESRFGKTRFENSVKFHQLFSFFDFVAAFELFVDFFINNHLETIFNNY